MGRLVSILIVIMFAQAVFAFNPAVDSAECYKNYILQKQKFNAINFNVLQLSPEQIKEFQVITEYNSNSYQQNLQNLLKETAKYKTMEENNLPLTDKISQKREIKMIYKNLKKISKNEDKNLKKILKKDQKRKYNLIKHLEMHDLKKELHHKDYYKLNPRLTKFGDLEARNKEGEND